MNLKMSIIQLNICGIGSWPKLVYDWVRMGELDEESDVDCDGTQSVRAERMKEGRFGLGDSK